MSPLKIHDIPIHLPIKYMPVGHLRECITPPTTLKVFLNRYTYIASVPIRIYI